MKSDSVCAVSVPKSTNVGFWSRIIFGILHCDIKYSLCYGVLCKYNQSEQGRKAKVNKGNMFKPVIHIRMGKSLVKVQSILKNMCMFNVAFTTTTKNSMEEKLFFSHHTVCDILNYITVFTVHNSNTILSKHTLAGY